MNQQTQNPRAPNSAVMLLLVGLVAGGAGGLLLSGMVPGFDRQDAVPEANLASEDPATPTPGENRVIDPGTSGGTGTRADRQSASEIPAADTGEAQAPAPDPLAAEALRAGCGNGRNWPPIARSPRP